jgi:hypothetical protein
MKFIHNVFISFELCTFSLCVLFINAQFPRCFSTVKALPTHWFSTWAVETHCLHSAKSVRCWTGHSGSSGRAQKIPKSALLPLRNGIWGIFGNRRLSGKEREGNLSGSDCSRASNIFSIFLILQRFICRLKIEFGRHFKILLIILLIICFWVQSN